MDKPIAIDLFTGLHGWAHGLIAEGWDVIGVDIEDMSAKFGIPKPDHFSLIIQDVLTLHGSQFKDAGLIVCSPPCQKYSYMAMPWKRAKAAAAAIRADETGEMLAELNRLFDACFRIQAQASLAAGRHIPLIVENVRGAQKWVGRARFNFGSYYFWGDVPALMPFAIRAQKFNPDGTAHPSGSWFAVADSKNRGAYKSRGMNWSDRTKRGQDFTRVAGNQAIGRKGGGGTCFHEYGPNQGSRNFNSKSLRRKEASALIAKIPLEVSTWMARCFKPTSSVAA